MQDRDAGPRRYGFAGFILDTGRGELSRDGVAVKLRPKAFEVLRHLVEHPGRLVGKQELLDAVWGRRVVTEGALTQCLIDIRRALGDDGSRLLRTVPRRGVILDCEVEFLAAQVSSAEPAPAGAAVADLTAQEPAVVAAPVAAGSADSPGAESAVTGGESSRAGVRPGWVALTAAVLAVVLMVVLLWRLPGAGPAGTSPDDRTTATNPREKRIAVLRFLDLSPTGTQQHLADGLGEEILHLLAQSSQLAVIARSSSFAYGPGEVDIATVARELEVSHVIEGSLRREGDTLRVTAQLIDAGSGTHVWSRTYDRPMGDVLRLQREIATDVARTLEVTLADAAGDTGRSAQAHELFLQGRYLFHRRGPGDLEAAEQSLRQAVEVDPGHAHAWTLLAGVYNARGVDELRDPGYRLDEQRAALERALALDPDLAEAHLRLARYAGQAGDEALREASLQRAYRLAPDDPLVLGSRSAAAVRAGRLEEALEFARRAVGRDPLSAVYRGILGYRLLGTGRFEEGLAELRRAGMLGPGLGRLGICRALVLLRRFDEARHECASVTSGPEADQLSLLLGDAAQAGAARERLAAAATPQALLLLAEAAAFQGDAAVAWAHLDAATGLVAAGPGGKESGQFWQDVEQSPFLRPLHDDPRWGHWR